MLVSVEYLTYTKFTHNLMQVSIYNTKFARNPQNYFQQVGLQVLLRADYVLQHVRKSRDKP